MFENRKKKSTVFSFIQLKKKFIKKLINSIRVLNCFKIQFYQSVDFFLFNSYLLKYKKDFLVSYIISFCFFSSNSVLHISDADGNLKISCSAGLVNFQGKQKVTRRLVLTRFLNILFLAKSKFLKNKPVALHFKNVSGSNKFLIVKKLKRKFFLKVIKTFDLNAYNGCRKKKERRKK